MKNKILLISFISFFIFVFVIFYKSLDNSNIYSPEVSKKIIPNFKAKNFINNTEINSNDVFKDSNFYLLNIWASWCVPCKVEHPILMNLNRIKSLKIIGLNYKDNEVNAKKFINQLGNPYSENLVDEDGKIAIELGAYGVPETFLINQEKKIIKKYIGPLNEKSFNEIKSILK
tara:strand:+ start:176 stop:694 length:519 start_codon:yes stop_codon:yes gene_type:complete